MDRPIVQLIKLKKSGSEKSPVPPVTDTQVDARCSVREPLMELESMNGADECLGSIVEHFSTPEEVEQYDKAVSLATYPEQGFPQPCALNHVKTRVDPDHVVSPSKCQSVQPLLGRSSHEAMKDLEDVLGTSVVQRWRKRVERLMKKERRGATPHVSFSEQGLSDAVNGDDATGEELTFDLATDSHNTLLRLNRGEANKLLWTSPVGALESDRPSSCGGEQESLASLRFHLHGYPVSEREGSEWRNTPELYHHGLEPEKPGYTLDEIVNFWLQSVHTKQRLMGLQTLLCIVKRSRELMPSRDHVNTYCSYHHQLWSTSPSSTVEGFSHRQAGFGYGLRRWNRFIFETMQLHYKTLLCLPCGTVSVQLAAMLLLSELLYPASAIPSTCLVLSSLQGPSLLCYSAPQFFSAYRRVIVDEHMPNLLHFLFTQDKNWTLDESIQRLRSGGPGCDEEDEKKGAIRGLSAFDSIVQLLFSSWKNVDTMGSFLGVFLSQMLKQILGDVYSELAVLRLLIILAFHSPEALEKVFFSCPPLVDALSRVISRVTLHTTQQEPQHPEGSHHRSPSQGHYALLCHFLCFFQVISNLTDASTQCSMMWRFFSDLTVPLVLVRQLLMIEITSRVPEAELCPSHALSVLCTWEVRDIWEEDLEAFFPHWLLWICHAKTLCRSPHRAQQREATQSIPQCSTTQHKPCETESEDLDEALWDAVMTRLALLGRYLWSALLHRSPSERLLEMGLTLLDEMVSALMVWEEQNIRLEDQPSFLHFVVHVVHMFLVLGSLIDKASVVFHKEGEEGSCVDWERHRIKFLNASQRFQDTNPQRLTLVETTRQEHLVDQMIQWMLECGSLGDYQQCFHVDTASLKVFFSLRLTCALCEFEVRVAHLRSSHFTPSWQRGSSEHLLMDKTTLTTSDLLHLAALFKHWVMEMSSKSICLGICQQHHSLCGAPDILRNILPINTLLFETWGGIQRLVEWRCGTTPNENTFHVVQWITVSTAWQLQELFSGADNNHTCLTQDARHLFQAFFMGQSSHQGESCVSLSDPLSMNCFFGLFRFIRVLISLYYRHGAMEAIQSLDHYLTKVLFDGTSGTTLFHTLVHLVFPSTLIEQLLLAYATLRDSEATWPSQPMCLEKALCSVWESVSQHYYQVVQCPTATTDYFEARFEKALPSFLVTFKTVPCLPPLALAVLRTLCHSRTYVTCERLIHADPYVLQLLQRIQ